MAYQLFDSMHNLVNLHDLQDKGPWCQTGESFEVVFVKSYGSQLGLIINPEKNINRYAPDLLNIRTSNIGDLKTQNTPFFQAESRYSLDPQYAVTFNQKDFTRYSQYYPEIEIYFWVKWLVTGFSQNGYKTNVSPLEGVWKIDFQSLTKLVIKAPLHSYAQRINDNKGNAKRSFVLSLNDPGFIRHI